MKNIHCSEENLLFAKILGVCYVTQRCVKLISCHTENEGEMLGKFINFITKKLSKHAPPHNCSKSNWNVLVNKSETLDSLFHA